jgi:ubiquinone/menaquinone biosynthesis C-methylase UbiE
MTVAVASTGNGQQPYRNPAPSVFEGAAREAWQKPELVVRALELHPGMVVVDLGAGSGFFTRRFAEAVGPTGKAIGLDVDPDMVAYMTADARERKLSNYEARLVKPDDAGLAPNTVDLIFLCDTYHLIGDRVAYFRRLKAALKPDRGRLVVVDFQPAAFPGSTHVMNPQVPQDELREAGYRLIKTDDFLPRQFFFVFVPAG